MTTRTDPIDDAGPKSAGSAWTACPRCRYSLRGLPARHACPECGLRYDEQCEIYRVTNPGQVLLLWIAIFGGGWIVLRNLRHLPDLAAASAWEKVGAVAALIWIPFVATVAWFLVRRYRRGFFAAVTTDGLILRLPGYTDDLVPWSDIDHASVKTNQPTKPQVASIHLKDRKRDLDIGGVANVFPTRSHVERFVGQVNQRVNAGEIRSG